MEHMRLISMYAGLHVLMMCCFNERSLSKMKPRLRTVPGNSVNIGIAEKDCLWVWQGRVDRGGG